MDSDPRSHDETAKVSNTFAVFVPNKPRPNGSLTKDKSTVNEKTKITLISSVFVFYQDILPKTGKLKCDFRFVIR
jgi:hypothetical protein